MRSLHARRLRTLLVAALFSALVLTPPGAANHGPADAVNAIHTSAVNSVTGATIVNGLVAGGLFSVHNTNTFASSGGIIGEGDGAGWGVEGGSTSGAGVEGISQTGSGVLAIGTGTDGIGLNAQGNGGGWGVIATTTALLRPAIRGVHPGATGYGPGTEGETFSTADFASGVQGIVGFNGAGAGAAGVKGQNKSSGVNGYGVWGEHQGAGTGVLGTSVNEVGVWGLHSASTGTSPGVEGQTSSNADFGSGVYGEANGTSALGTGVLGNAANGIGVLGLGGSVGVVGYKPNGTAGLFVGNLSVTGTLTKGAGAFRIDHPLDPANKYLQHSFVESPDMKNVYDGVVTTDRRGFATVRLPAYFQALNRDFRYQLTPIGRKAWDARAGIWQEIGHNRFVIRSEPRTKISWQVTGIRRDRYANAHRIQPEVLKSASARGRYLSPELYGKPQSRDILTLPASAFQRSRP